MCKHPSWSSQESREQLLLSSGMTRVQFLSPEGIIVTAVPGRAELIAGGSPSLSSWEGTCLPPELPVLSSSGPYHLEHPRMCRSFRAGYKPGQLHRTSSRVYDLDLPISLVPLGEGVTDRRGNLGGWPLLP